MPHNAVQAGGHDRLIHFEGDRGCGVTVLEDDQHRSPEPDDHHDVAEYRDRRRHGRPPEPMVESGHDEQGCEAEGQSRHHELLNGTGLVCRTGLPAAFHGRRIDPIQKKARNQRHTQKDGNERPPLPVGQGSGRHEQQHAERENPENRRGRELDRRRHSSRLGASNGVAGRAAHSLGRRMPIGADRAPKRAIRAYGRDQDLVSGFRLPHSLPFELRCRSCAAECRQ